MTLLFTLCALAVIALIVLSLVGARRPTGGEKLTEERLARRAAARAAVTISATMPPDVGLSIAGGTAGPDEAAPGRPNT